MAEQVSQIKVEIDTEEAQAKLNQLYETQAKLVGEMSKVEEGSEAYKGLGDSLGETNKQIGSIESNIGKQKMGLNELDDVTNAASISVTNLGLAETTLGKVINSAADVVGKIKTATNAYTKAQQAANVAINSGTKATKGLNMAMKGNILISVITMALPLIMSLIDKLKEAGKETLTLADRLDMIKARYERLQNILSKLGVSEIVALSVEQRRLNEEIKATEREYDKMRFEGEKVTAKQLGDLEQQKKSLKGIQQQIKYLNEDQERTNKLLKEQADLDKRISQNTNALSTAQARLEIEKERNGYSEKYFDILKDTARLEEEGYRLQEESLDNKKKAIDDEFAVYKKRINETEEMSDEEKEKEISIRAQTVELEKQAIANQKSTIAYERQLSALIKQKALISEMKQLEEANLRLTIQMNESSTRVYASNVRNLDDMYALYNSQNDQMALFRKGMVEWEATMKKTTGIKTFGKDAVDEFFKKWNELQESNKKVLEDLKQNDESTWTKDEKDFYKKYRQWSELSAQYASGMNQLVTDLGANMATTAEAQMNAMGAMFQYYVAGSKDAAWDQYAIFLKDITGLKALYKQLENENKGEKSDNATLADFNAFLQPKGGDDPDERKGARDFYETLQKAGSQGLELLKNYITTLNDGRIEVYKQIDEYILESNRATVDYFASAMTVGLASYKEYLGAYDNLLTTQAGQAKNDIDLQADNMKKAGVDEIKIAEWVKKEKEKIDKDYEVNSKQIHQNANVERLQMATNFVNDMSSTFSDLYDDDKEVQKATIVTSTIANAAMAFGSTFADTKGELWAKAAMATAASAAVLASGIKAYRQVDSANKGTTLSGGGGSSSAIQTGTSAVSSTIIERQIQPVRTTSSTETVLVLSDVEAKQRQQQNVNKVSVI